MITNFKIFESVEKKFYYTVINVENILKIDNRLKRNKIIHSWFKSDNDDNTLVLIAIMTEKQKNSFKRGILWNENKTITLHIMTNLNPIYNIDEFYEDWKIKNQAKKYNI